jgi:hypothetical protein
MRRGFPTMSVALARAKLQVSSRARGILRPGAAVLTLPQLPPPAIAHLATVVGDVLHARR